jgi:hypothetical protein
MDKKVLYALLGGAAVVGAAIVYFATNKEKVEDEGDMEDDLANLGEPQFEASGMLKFEYFLKIFQICSFYGKNQFRLKKKEFIRQRRAALEKGDDKEYESIVMSMTQEEEMLIQSKLQEIIERIGLNEMDFQKNVAYHGQDQMKGMQIMQMQQ